MNLAKNVSFDVIFSSHIHIQQEAIKYCSCYMSQY